jgi:simple sugar transport system permease protein
MPSPLLGGQSLPVWLALLAVPLTHWVMSATRFGLRLRAVGENPYAVDTDGISVGALRYLALCWTGVLCGLAGASLSIALNAGFVRDMTAGRGFLALAALVFGKWRPVPTLLACLLFAFADALQLRLQGVGAIPVQLVQALPYVLTVLLLAGFVGGARPPGAIGMPFTRSR